MAFYEPLSERLAEVNLDAMLGIRPETWDSGHPDPERAYFEEFAPLLSGTEPGVTGYQSAFAIDQYFAGSDYALPQLAAYIESLIELARSCEKTPVMKYCRSMGRIGWMRAAFPLSVHVVVLRNPWHQWLSGWEHYVRYGNPYFVAMPFVIMTRHCSNASIVRATDVLKLRLSNVTTMTLEERYTVCVKTMMNVPPVAAYRAFLAVWTVTTYDALKHAQMIIDTDQLASSSSYRNVVEQQFSTLTGIPVDLSGARATEDSDSPWSGTFDVERSHQLAIELCDAFEYSADEERDADAAMIVRTKLRVAASAPPVLIDSMPFGLSYLSHARGT